MNTAKALILRIKSLFTVKKISEQHYLSSYVLKDTFPAYKTDYLGE